MVERATREIRENNGDTVTVACKLPNGLILRNFDMVDDFEPVLGGGSRPVRRAIEIPDSIVKINGTSLDLQRMAMTGDTPDYLIIHGYAMTSDVPKHVWENWLADNKDSPIVRNRLIYAQDDEREARAAAHDGRQIKSGFEAVDPDNPAAKTGARVQKFNPRENQAAQR